MKCSYGCTFSVARLVSREQRELILCINIIEIYKSVIKHKGNKASFLSFFRQKKSLNLLCTDRNVGDYCLFLNKHFMCFSFLLYVFI